MEKSSSREMPVWTSIYVGREPEAERLRRGIEQVRLACVQGLPGMGKTTFMLREGSALAQARGGRLLYHSCTEGDRPPTVARSLVEQLGETLPVGDVSLLEWLRRFETASLVLCVDDLHRTSDPAVLATLVRCARELPWLRVLLGSRRQVPLSPLETDFLRLKLNPLDAGEVQQLWENLEQLHGMRPSARLPQTGSPWSVRAAFAGAVVREAGASDPLRALLGQLSPSGRDLLACVCLSQERHGVASYREMLGPATLEPGLRELEEKMLLEPGQGGALWVHDLVREAVSASALVRPEHHRRLAAHYRRRWERDASLRAQVELIHHLIAGEEQAAAIEQLELLAQRHLGLVPFDAVSDHRATHELMGLLERKVRLPVSVQLLGARLRARQGEPALALEMLRAIRTRDFMVEFERGVILMMLGRFQEATHAFRRPWRDPQAPSLVRLLSAINLADVRRATGRFSAARRLLAQAEEQCDELAPMPALLCNVMRAGIAHDEQKYFRAELGLQAASQAIKGSWVESIEPALEQSLRSLVQAARGEAKPLTSWERATDILYFDITSQLLSLEGRLWAGELSIVIRDAAIEEQRARVAGYVPLVLWSIQLGARAELLAGRVGQGQVRAERALALPQAAQSLTALWRLRWVQAWAALESGALEASVSALEALEALRPPRWLRHEAALLRGRIAALQGKPVEPGEPVAPRKRWRHGGDVQQRLAWIELTLLAGKARQAWVEGQRLLQSLPPETLPVLRARACVLLAQAALLTGAPDDAEAWLHQREAVGGPGQGLQALALALQTTCARARGEEPLAASLLTRAIELASSTGQELLARALRAARSSWQAVGGSSLGPAELLAARMGLLGRPTVLVASSRAPLRRVTPSLGALLDHSDKDTVLDGPRRLLRLPGQTLTFRERDLSWRLLSALASAGGPVEASALFTRVWGETFHPLRHQNRLNVTLHRLREQIGADLIRTGADGYQLHLAAPWVVVTEAPGEG